MKGICKKILSLVLTLAMVVQLFAALGNVAEAGDATGVTINNVADNSAVVSNADGTVTYQIYLSTDYKNTGATWANWENNTQVIVNGQAQKIDGACWASDILLYVQITLPAETPLENMRIDAGKQFTINGVTLEIQNTYNVYYYDGGYHNTAKVEGKPVTITGIDYTRTVFANNTYQIYLTTDYTNTGATWGGWDNSTNVLVDGVDKRADTCWASDVLLYVQVAVDAGTTAESIKIDAGKQFTINGEIIEIQNECTVYYYDGAFHDEPKVTGKPVTITGIDYTRTVLDTTNNWYGIYLTTNYTNTGATWGGWDNTTNVCVDGVDKRADTCWVNTGANSLLYIQVAVDAGITSGSVKIDAGKQFTINGEIIEIQNECTVYYYDGGFHDTEKVLETPVTITGINTAASVFDGSNYQLHLFTDQTNTGATWANWDNGVAGVINENIDCIVDACWSADGLLYLQPRVPEGVVFESLTIKAGTQITINSTLYEIQNDYTAYYYMNGWHSTAKVWGKLVTIEGINTNSSVFASGLYQIHLFTDQTDTGATWAGWDNGVSGIINGNTACVVNACWSADGLLYLQPNVPNGVTLESLTIKKETQFTINNVLYEFAEDYTVYYKNNVFADAPLYTITKTVGDTTVVETVSGDYTLPEITAKEGYIALGWDVDGDLYKVGTTRPANSAGYTIKAVYAAFSQIGGAQVRLTTANENEEIGGIRFVCKLGSDSKSEHIVQMGLLIMPTNYMTNGELTHANYIAQTEEYGTVKGYREFVVDNANMQLEVYAQDTAANGAEGYYLKGSIVNLYDYNYTRSYSARSFLKVQYADGVEYVYSDYNKDNNARKICDIAKKMIETYPDQYAPIKNKTYPIVYEYAKVADTMESFAFFGPEVVITNDAYDAAATKTAMQEYVATGFKYLWLDSVNYHYHDRYSASSVEAEQLIYDNPSHPSFDLKQTMKLAKESGLEVIVLDWALRQLSVSDIALVNSDAASRQAIGLWLQTGDAETVELIGSAIDESKFSTDFSTYTYDGASVTGYASGQARVLNYVYQFESEEALQEWVAIKMSAYAKEDNFRGVMLADEPSEATFAQLAMVTKVIKKLYPNAYVQNSNLPCYGYQSGSGMFWDPYNDGYDDWSADDGAWKKLLQAHANAQSGITETGINFYPFARWYHNPIIGSDYYTYELRDHYLASLQFLATTTRDADINLEFTIQSYGVEKLYAEITKAKLDLQANLALAFGTKTLGYFRYNTTDDGIEPGSDNWTITQTINTDDTLKSATLYQNKNGNYLKAHMTFFEYQASKVFGTGTYMSTDGLEQATTLKKNIITVPSGATVLVNEFYNEHTDQYGYYVVNLAQLNDEDGNNTSNAAVTITLSTECQVYQDYTKYASEKDSKVSTVTLADGQGAFIVVE